LLHSWLSRIARALGRRRYLARGASRWIQALAAIATLVAIGIGLLNHFGGDHHSSLPGEGERVVAFRQLADRMCAEGQENQRRALGKRTNRVARLGFAARAVGWNRHDLESITAPPSMVESFIAEVKTRARGERILLALQSALESGDRTGEASAVTELNLLENESREFSQESDTNRCAHMLPPARRLLRR
jgi:hypothetical protein